MFSNDLIVVLDGTGCSSYHYFDRKTNSEVFEIFLTNDPSRSVTRKISFDQIQQRNRFGSRILTSDFRKTVIEEIRSAIMELKGEK